MALTILVVDDDKAIRDLLALHLGNAGYRVLSAEDAVEGARMLLEKSPDLLVVDAHLPYWSGLDFIATLMADRELPCPPIVVITGSKELSARAELIADACLVKPFLSTQLLDSVSICLARRSMSAAGVKLKSAVRAA
jgi:two-component system response regulator RpaA